MDYWHIYRAFHICKALLYSSNIVMKPWFKSTLHPPYQDFFQDKESSATYPGYLIARFTIETGADRQGLEVSYSLHQLIRN